MAINDFVWVIFWVLFFDRVGTLGGWDRDSIILLQAVLTTAGGLSLGLFANARSIGTMAVGGDLDAVLALPVSPLRFVLLRRINPVNLGDLAFGIGLFFVACDPTPAAHRGLRARQPGVGHAAHRLPRAHRRAGVLHRSQRERRARLPRDAAARRLPGRRLRRRHPHLPLHHHPRRLRLGGARHARRRLRRRSVPSSSASSPPSSPLAAGAIFTAGLRRYTSGNIWTRA